MKDLEEVKILKEHNFDECREKSLAVCDLVAQGTSLKTALSLQRLESADFYRMKLEVPEIQKAYTQAQQMLAEIKLGDLSDLGRDLIDTEGLNTNTFNAVTKNERWIIEKLSPERFGTRPNAAPTSMVQNNVQILQGMTDEQIIALASGAPMTQPLALPVEQTAQIIEESKKVLDTPAIIDYKEDSSGGTIAPFVQQISPSSVTNTATDLTLNSNSPGSPSAGSSYSLESFGDFK